jgi:hypothetical protein
MVEVLPVHVDPLEARILQEIELRGERDHVSDVVLMAGLLVGGSILPFRRRFGVTPVSGPQPGCLDDCVPGRDGVVVEVPASGTQMLQDLGEQLPLAFVGEVMDAE